MPTKIPSSRATAVTIRVLLLDNTKSAEELLERQSAKADSVKLSVTRIPPKLTKSLTEEKLGEWDVILFGENIATSAVHRLTRLLRSRSHHLPIFMMSRRSEARVPGKLQKAGVDDMLDVAAMNTPLFSWAFMSTLRRTEISKKVKELRILHGRLQTLNETLALIAHEINNPLGVIRLTLPQLGKADLSHDKKQTLFETAAEHVQRISDKVADLHDVNRQLNGHVEALSEVLAANKIRDLFPS